MRFLCGALLLCVASQAMAATPDVSLEQDAADAPDISSAINLSGSLPGLFPHTRFSMGGFGRLHILSGDVSPGRRLLGDQMLFIPHIPVRGSEASRGDRLLAHAKDSRIWFRAVTPSQWGNVEALAEFDLYDTPERHQPRVRHLYGIFGRLLVGQTFTTFTNTSALADLDAAIAVGNVVTRQPMLRWTQPLADGMNLALALEQPLSRINRAGEPGFSAPGGESTPDLVARFTSSGPWGNVSLAAMARQVTTSQWVLEQGTQQWGGALSLAGRIEIGALDNVRFMFNHGNTLARYSTLGAYADGIVEAEGNLQLNTIHSSMVAYQHFWTPQWRSSLGLSHSRASLPTAAVDDLTRASRSAHANLIWAPTPRASVGLEYLYAERELQDGRGGELSRFQVTIRVNF